MPLFENPGSFLLSMDDEFSPDESVMNKSDNKFTALNESSDDQ
jgi:hypothetical protein